MCHKLPSNLCLCNFMLYFGGAFLGFFSSAYLSPPWNLDTPFQGSDFSICAQMFLCQVHFMLSLEYVFSVMHLALFFYVCVWLYYFVCLFSRLSQATHSVFYYTQLLFHCMPRMLLMETLMEEEITHWVLQSLGQCLTQHLQVLAVQLETKVKKTCLFFYSKLHWMLSLKFVILFFFQL